MKMGDRRKLRIGIVCYPTHGGSGVVAVELAHGLADRGHDVHVISYAVPPRLDTLHSNLRFHSVRVPEYPLFEYPPYSLALAARLAQVACRFHLDVLHAHYALPHAVSGWLAKQIAGIHRMPVVTTLHGTDITLIGIDPSYLPVTRFSLERSDAVTVVSKWLGKKVDEVLGCECPWEVVYNSVDTERFHPRSGEDPRPFHVEPGIPVLMHLSNYRPVKRVPDVVEMFLKLRERMPVHLALVGDGPELTPARLRLEQSRFAADVSVLGQLSDAERILPHADLFVFPSNAESFGLAALEAMACGVPVIGYRAGGLPEVVEDGVTGHLLPLGDVDGMVDAATLLLSDAGRYEAMSRAAQKRAAELFQPEPVVDRYEEIYWRAIERLEKTAASGGDPAGRGVVGSELPVAIPCEGLGFGPPSGAEGWTTR